MKTTHIIAGAQEHARRAKEKGLKSLRLPVLRFEEWAELYGRSDDLAGREAYRAGQKRNFYFKRFLEAEGIEVTMITCQARAVAGWAEAHGHPMNSDPQRTHVLAHYVNQPDLPPARCVHKRPLTPDLAESGLELYATMSMYGENPDRPEVLSTVVHTRDGLVVESLEVLAVEHSPREAFRQATELMTRHGVTRAFHDPGVHRMEFCPDCGELLVAAAGPWEYERMGN